MKFLTDLFPIILFFIAFKFYGIYTATAVAIAASLLQVAYCHFINKKVDGMQWATLIMIVLLGGATLFFHNELFIKWKPTALEWLFALIFLGSQWISDKSLTQRMLESNVSLPTFCWRRLNLSWVIFFFVMGALNVYVLYHFSTNAWVNFKLFGLMGFTVLFVIGQAFYISKYLND